MCSWRHRISTNSQVFEGHGRQTHSKKIGEFTLACEPAWYMGDQSGLNADEEAEALRSLEEILTFLKAHLIMDSLRRTLPIKVETKNSKIVTCAVSEAYWDAWEAELVRRTQEGAKKEIEEEGQKNTQ